MCVLLYVCMYADMYVFIFVFMYACMSICMYDTLCAGTYVLRGGLLVPCVHKNLCVLSNRSLLLFV